jgi:hypothetical protein
MHAQVDKLWTVSCYSLVPIMHLPVWPANVEVKEMSRKCDSKSGTKHGQNEKMIGYLNFCKENASTIFLQTDRDNLNW